MLAPAPLLPLICLALICLSPSVRGAEGPQILAGFAKIDVTPDQPLRLSGYGNRDRPSAGVETPLAVRCMALRGADQSNSEATLLITFEAIGVSGGFSADAAARIQMQFGIPRDAIAFSSTHTHAAPHLASTLEFIYSTPLTDDERQGAEEYEQRLKDTAVEAASAALADLKPVRLEYGLGEAGFAANRRVIENGRWKTFGVQADGPVDHTVNVLKVIGENEQVVGVVFNYACHCTTVGGDYNQVNGDWAGYASRILETKYSGATALCTIGCGADQNPEPRGNVEFVQKHGSELADEVIRVLNGDLQQVDALPAAKYQLVALPFDLPTAEELKERLASADRQTVRHAQHMLDVLERKGRLAESYPYPVQTWQFGDDLTMVFLGGEVVVDYALKLKELLGQRLWATAYSNDVVGYIAAERMIDEGGYEYDRSGIYYGLPGPWARGTEEKILESVERQLESDEPRSPLSATESLRYLDVVDGYRIELVAAEPLVRDPINIAFDADGYLWVVEMGDYPESEGGGSVKRLSDTDGDGVYDSAATFLSDLTHPTGVHPTQDGVWISCAPDLLFARDDDGDGVADDVEKRFSGFELANPQHRVSGFTYGLDHTLHLSAGDNLEQPIVDHRSGRSVSLAGCDAVLDLASGELRRTNGRTQYLRTRDDWGDWFGNDNSNPLFHFPLTLERLDRNQHVRTPSGRQLCYGPINPPPVYPARLDQRFNDLSTLNRFTSACSSTIARVPAFEPEGATVYVCEPVHNLVHRSLLVADGASFRAERYASEADREFLVSSDAWFRPVCVKAGPDGALWVVDMYRETIEHPEWIPDGWQATLDLRAGSDRGRIYRVVPASQNLPLPKSLDDPATAITSEIGPLRDLAQQTLLDRGTADSVDRGLVFDVSLAPAARVQVLWLMACRGDLTCDDLKPLLVGETHAGLLKAAIDVAEQKFPAAPELWLSLTELTDHADLGVVKRLAAAIGRYRGEQAGRSLAEIASREDLDAWTQAAIAAAATGHAATVLDALLTSGETLAAGVRAQPSSVSGKALAAGLQAQPEPAAGGPVAAVKPASSALPLAEDLLVTAAAGGIDIAQRYGHLIEASDRELGNRLQLASLLLQASKRLPDKQIDLPVRSLYQDAVRLAKNSDAAVAQRREALSLLGIGLGDRDEEIQILSGLLDARVPAEVQTVALERMMRLGEDGARQSLAAWPRLSTPLRERAVDELLTRYARKPILVDAIEANVVAVDDLSPAAKQRILHSGDRSLRVRAARLLERPGDRDRQAVIDRYQAAFDNAVDIERGRQMYVQHCRVCHEPDAAGRMVGVSLANLSNPSTSTFLEAILDPNRAIDPRGQAYAIETIEGQILLGVLTSESTHEIVLTHADGRQSQVARRDIEQLKNTRKSLMPEGFEAVLDPQTMEDLIAFLRR